MIDDHPYVREGVRAMLAGVEGIEIVGEAADAQSATELLSTTEVDCVLLDLNLPGKSGIRAAHELKTLNKKLKIIILSMYDSPQFVLSARRAGACGYVVKTEPRERLIEQIRNAANGLSSMPDQVSFGTAPWEVLTPTELDVACLIAKNLSHRRLAQDLGKPLRTIDTHHYHIREKLRKLTPPIEADPLPLARWLQSWGELD
ncbi:MAG TPA: response regulator [Polyangiaceae bacterium]|nr:response regulator [Polyangiaceae bacterium]